METLEELAKKGEGHDIMDALTLLTKAYISMCGISIGYRTVVYCAAEEWQERLAWLDFPLSEMARKEPLVNLMPHVTNEYDPDIYDEYDITGMSLEEVEEACRQIVRNHVFDEPTTEVLCWGVVKCTETWEKTLSQEVEAIAPDGTLLKGVLTDQSCSHTHLSMYSPYVADASKIELVREPKDLLVEAYEEYQRLRGMESEIRALYTTYQEEISKLDEKQYWRRLSIFRHLYEPILKDTVLFPWKLFKEWFDLDFDLF